MDGQERRLCDGAIPSKVHVDTTSGDCSPSCKAFMEDVAADHSYCKGDENVSSEMSAIVTEQRLRFGSDIYRVTISRRQNTGEAVGEAVAGETIGGAVTDNSKSFQPRFKENALAINDGDDFRTTEEPPNIAVRPDTTFHHNLPDNSQVRLTASGSTQYNNSMSKVSSSPAIMETSEDADDECTETLIGAPHDEDVDQNEDFSPLLPSGCVSPDMMEFVDELLQDGDW